MFNILLIIFGISFLAYATVLCRGLKSEEFLDKEIISRPCLIITLLVHFFILGYIAFIIYLVRNINSQATYDLLVSLIFFFGAVFVVIVLKINNKLVMELANRSMDLKKVNSDLKNKNKDLVKKSSALELSEDKYKKQTKELEETLDDFYTMRLSMEKQMQDGTLEEENKKIKERIDDLKKK